MTGYSFDYMRGRKLALAVFLVSLAVFVPALVIPRSGEDLSFRTALLFFSLAATLISGVWLMVVWNDARQLIRLRAGEGILARWTVDRARWEWFRNKSAEWDKLKDIRPNDVNLEQDPGIAGIEIVVTLDGVLVGSDFRPVEKGPRITVRPDWMEFYQVIPKPKGPPLYVVLRLPLQPGKESLAVEIQQAYAQAAREGPGARVSLAYLALGIFVGMPAVTALIGFIAWLTGWI